uniref:hypothetical protein n=1 Tax=Bacteroides fragilis TaxID=817 RepID=UPI003562F83B
MSKIAKKQNLHIRISEEEEKAIKAKAKKYPSLSAYILDAALHFDDRQGIFKIEMMDKWATLYLERKNLLSNIASNINQLAHYANQCKNVGVVNEKLLSEIESTIKTWNSLAQKIISENREIVNAIKK